MTHRVRSLTFVAALAALAAPGAASAQAASPEARALAPSAVRALEARDAPAPAPAPDDAVRFRKLPDAARYNAHPAWSPVDATPEIRALQDPAAEARYRQQLDRARALKAMKDGGPSSLERLDAERAAPRRP